MLPLLALKLSAALTMVIASAFGAWAPLCCQQRSLHRPRSSFSCATGRSLSLASCFSSGMLLAMALAHFLPSAFASAGDSISPVTLCGCVLVGLLFPALLERGMVSRGGVEDGNSSHAHSHTRGYAHGHTHGQFFSSDSPFTAVSTLLVVLMCFHSAIEGFLIGSESSAAALASSAIPLIIHRLFDGLVVGVALAKELQRFTDTGSPIEPESPSSVTPLTGTNTNEWGIALRRMSRPAVMMWLAITPVAALAAAAIPGDLLAYDRNSGKGGTTMGHQSHGGPVLVAAQAVGSGSFIFVALTALGQEELHGPRACVALLAGVAFATVMSTMEQD